MQNNYWTKLYQQSLKARLEEAPAAPITLNHHLDKNAFVTQRQQQWRPSPAKGVRRLMLERNGGEKTTRATSIVAYEPNSRFAAHNHPLGEEFFVLHGTFSDEYGDYSAGSYVRNPPGSSHSPHSEEGCLMLVKLQQFQPNDRQRVVKHLSEIPLQNHCFHIPSKEHGLQSQLLFDDYEQVSMVQVTENTSFAIDDNLKGLEILIIAGAISVAEQRYQTGDWIRIANGQAPSLSLDSNSRLLVKSGHL